MDVLDMLWALGVCKTCHWAAYVPFGTLITWKVMVQNMPRYHPICFRKYECGKGQTGEKNRIQFVLTAFNFFTRFNIFLTFDSRTSGAHGLRCWPLLLTPEFQGQQCPYVSAHWTGYGALQTTLPLLES
jgi:hypothetical protein